MHLAAGLAEGVPRDVEPAWTGEQLVGVLAGLEEVHEALELLRVHRPDIGSLTYEVLRPGDATHQLPPGCKDYSDYYLSTRPAKIDDS